MRWKIYRYIKVNVLMNEAYKEDYYWNNILNVIIVLPVFIMVVKNFERSKVVQNRSL